MTYNHHHQAYTNASHMVRKTKQVVLLYEGVIKAVMQARQAIEDNDIQTRYNSLTKATDILTGLQLSLDHDNGGEVAQLLHDYYSGLDMRLMSVHRSEDLGICDLCIKHLKMMKEAWEEIDNNQSAGNITDQKNISKPLTNAMEGLSLSC